MCVCVCMYTYIYIYKYMIKIIHRRGLIRYYHSGQSGLGSNVNEMALDTPKISKTGASTSDAVLCHHQVITIFGGGVSYPSAKNTVNIS